MTAAADLGVPIPWRLAPLAAGGFALLAGIYGGLMLIGAPVPAVGPALADVHGPVLVLGFVGTLVALERAVALGRRWALLAPASSGAGALVLVLAGPVPAGKALLTAAGAALLAVYGALWRRRPSPALLAQAAGAACWYAAGLLWLAGFAVPELVFWLAGVPVATVAGERLELAHLVTGASARRWFLAALAALMAGATATALWPAAGAHLFGAGLLAVAAWLWRFDVARTLIRGAGLPRYVAAGLLCGYAWLALAGLLWAGSGGANDGPRYDATVHAVFLGFTMSMIFAHAPVILPAVLRQPLPYHRVLYAPLALLHASLLARVLLGDGLGLTAAWRWSAAANVAAVLLFAGTAVTLAIRRSASGSPQSRTPAAAVPR